MKLRSFQIYTYYMYQNRSILRKNIGEQTNKKKINKQANCIASFFRKSVKKYALDYELSKFDECTTHINRI